MDRPKNSELDYMGSGVKADHSELAYMRLDPDFGARTITSEVTSMSLGVRADKSELA